jgi:putative ABC transport system permease protein
MAGKVSLARATLLYEWRRFLPAVFAEAFAALLVLVSAALLLGMFGTVSVYVDQSRANLWVGFRDTPSVDLGRPIAGRYEALIRMHPEVKQVEPLQFIGTDWRRPGQGAVFVYVVGVDPRDNGLGLGRLLDGPKRALLATPDDVLVDVADLGKLGVGVGDSAEINGRRVRVAGTVDGLRAIGGANVVTSLHTARRLDLLPAGDAAVYLLVALTDPARAAAVRDALQPRGADRRYSVWTAEELAAQSERYWLFESGAGMGFLFSTALGLIVGVVITSQTLMAAIMASLREYAALRALGVSLRSLAAIVLAQAFWVGVAAIAVSTLAAAAVLAVAAGAHVAVVVTPWLAALTVALLFIISAASGLYALRTLAAGDPATLLR